jgi:hypothetical protein
MTDQAPKALAAARRQVLAILPKRAVGAEIGVWRGDFSAEILKVAAPRKLYLIDPWLIRDDAVHEKAWYGTRSKPDMEGIYQNVLKRFAVECESGTVVVKRARSEETLSEFPDGYFDFIYIDGDHEYSAVRKDCFLAYEKVRTGGYICGDDYRIGGWWKDGVVRAFHELISERPVLIHYTRGTQIVLQKRAQHAAAVAGLIAS